MLPFLVRSCTLRQSRFPAAVVSNTTTVRAFSDSLRNGVVKWFDAKKGFGFIIPEDGGDDVFVHQTSIHAQGFRSLAEGEPVEFTTFADERGRPKAERVTGPMGSFVQGAARGTFGRSLGGGPPQDFGGAFGRSSSSPFGSGGFGSNSSSATWGSEAPQMPPMEDSTTSEETNIEIDAATSEEESSTTTSAEETSSTPSEDDEAKEESTTTSSSTTTTTSL